MKAPNDLGVRSHKPKIYIGTDHAGFELKEKLIPFVKSLGYQVIDCGDTKPDESDDYPDFIAPVAKAVSLNPENNIGIILGGSGQGEAMVANRFPNVRAIVYYGEPSVFKKYEIIRLGREHNDANIISLGARFIKIDTAKAAVKTWLDTKFSNVDRHVRRIKKIERISREIKQNLDYK